MVLVFDEMDEHDDDNALLMDANESSGDVWNGIGDLDDDDDEFIVEDIFFRNKYEQFELIDLNKNLCNLKWVKWII